MLVLETGDYRLQVDPARGGAVLRFDWRGEPLMRPVCGSSIFDVACFPLVPFSNRIAHGRFIADEREVRLAPNFPDADHPHPLHGFGWLAAWNVLEASPTRCILEHRYPGGEWPWPYRARETFMLDCSGLTISLDLENLAATAMPAGLGFHPYFPRGEDTRYWGLHRGEWQNSNDCLPVELDFRPLSIDWWEGISVGGRAVDTAYAGREGPLRIAWPSRGISLRIEPSAELDHTVVFTPTGANFFCVEPVSHATNAVNAAGAMTSLEPGATLTASMRLNAAVVSDPAI
jgi:aldose 1-epimerase